MIKVQNWGENIAFDVDVQDTLPTQVEYVPGTTEIATKFDSYGNGTDWKPFEDVNGGFPFAQPRKVADQIYYCDKSAMTCEEGVWIRFAVRPKDNLSKNEVIKNTAVISDKSNVIYYTNSNIPLRLRLGKCPSVAECEIPPKAQCGGEAIDPGDTGPDSGDTSGDTGSPDTGDAGNTEPDSGNTGDTGSSDSGDPADTDPTDPEGSTEPKQGELGAECYPDRTCNDGLLCRASDNTCFAPEAAKSSGCSVMTLDQDFRM